MTKYSFYWRKYLSYLYINSRGFPVTRHSYSGSASFNHCARKYYLERIAGWRDKSLDKSASMAFGRVMENTITTYHGNNCNLNAAWEFFDSEWTKYRDQDLDYSAKNGSWADLWCTGNEMLRLYNLRYPKMPFEITGQNNFQLEKKWEVFPNTDFAGIELRCYLDILAKLKEGRFADADTDKVILDMKVSTTACPSFVSLDPQLRTYSMVTKYPVVGFLWFQICSRTLEKGTEVVLLENAGPFKPLDEVVVLNTSITEDEKNIYITSFQNYEKFQEIKGQSAAAKEERLKFITEYGILTPIANTTRQKIEVSLAVVSDDSREDIRKQVEQDIIRICNASETDFWPQQGGVRYPNNKCVTCPMRGICSSNTKLRDELLERTSEDIF